MHARWWVLKAAACMLSITFIAGCAAVGTASTRLTPNSSNPRSSPAPSPRTSPANSGEMFSTIDTAGPPPLVVQDTSPGHLALSLYLSVGGYDASTRDVTEVAISFSSLGRSVQFVADETVTCNGIALSRGGGTFDVKVPTDALAGKPVMCRYTSGQSSATMAFTMPVAPAILSPKDNMSLARSTRTAVAFRVGAHSTMFWVIALGPSKKAWSYPAAGATQVLLDTSAFSPGPGFIALNQFFDLPDLHGSGFQSVEVHGQAIQQNSVTWQ